MAMANVAKARGMTKVARDAGLGRESLYKALAPGAKPRYETVRKLLDSLGVRLIVEAASNSFAHRSKPFAGVRHLKTDVSSTASEMTTFLRRE